MRTNLLLRLAVVLTLGFAGIAHAKAPTEPTAAQSTQENKMKTCAQQYHQQNIPKNQYRSFMSNCLKKSPNSTFAPAAAAVTAPAAVAATPAAASPAPATTAAAPVSQKDKMKSCNADAKTQGLKGADRKTFMKTCLSK